MRRVTNSLRAQVLLGIFSALLVSWLVQFGFYWNSLVRAESGVRDRELNAVVDSIAFFLAMVPATHDITRELPVPAVLLPQAIGKTEIQVWDRVSNRLVLASKDAPRTRMVHGNTVGFACVVQGGDTWRVYTALDESARFEIVAGTPTRAFYAGLANRFELGSIVTLLMFAGIGGITMLVVCRSVRKLGRVARDIAEASLTDGATVDEQAVPAEVGPLIRAINERQRRVATLIESERRFIGDAAHELRTPLAVLAVYADTAYRVNDPVKARMLMQKIAQTTRRSSRIVEQLLDLARTDRSDIRLELVNLASVVAFVLRDMQASFIHRGQQITVNAEPVLILGQVDALGILVRNLLDNAGRYSGENSAISIALHSGPEGVTLAVADNGPGIARPLRERIFDPFYRGPGAPSHGSGLGLALVARIARSHHARVTVEECAEGLGVCFNAVFPLPGATAAASRGAWQERLDRDAPDRGMGTTPSLDGLRTTRRAEAFGPD